ncbi:MAG: PAS domain S-box protein [Candidatus Acidiferrum sp.]
MTDKNDELIPLETILLTEELDRRPLRQPDFEKENRALVALTKSLSDSPQTILQTLTDTILNICDCGSAGISLLTTHDGGKRFYWPAISGQWQAHIGGGTPRDFGPCGTVLDRNCPLLFTHVERVYTYFEPVTPSVEEALLVPFYVENKAVGTIWAVAHDHSHKFDAEDKRLLLSLGRFASAAYQALIPLDASRQLAAIVESSDDAIISKSLDGIISSWNRSAEWLFGYTAEEAIGQHITLIIPPDRIDEESMILEQLRRGQRVDHFETIRMRKDGTLIDISLTISPIKDSSGRVVGASKVARDVTERKRVERAVAEQARLLDLSFDAIFVRDQADRITYWNDGARQLYGYTSEEALGGVSHDLLRTKFPEALDQITERLNRDRRWTGELIHKRKDGSQIVVASRWALDQRDLGNANSVLETNSDITQHKEAEKARREAEISARLLVVQDEERRRIARELHDGVGNLLAGISMNAAQIAKEKEKLSEPRARCLEENLTLIGQACAEIRTVSYLLHPPLLDEAGLQSALKWYVDGFAERSKIKVTLDIAPDVDRLSQDYELSLFRIAQECLTNVHRHSGSFTALVRLSRTPGRVEMEVRDEGKGIKPEIQAKFAAGSSAGVGLRGMQERVRSLGGELTVQSTGNGTSVLVALPLTQEVDIQSEQHAQSRSQIGIS